MMMLMRLVTPILLILLMLLQYRIWFGKNSVADHLTLSAAVTKQQAANAKLLERNRLLEQEIADLKKGYDAIEERARNELGLIRKGEVFYRIYQPTQRDVHE